MSPSASSAFPSLPSRARLREAEAEAAATPPAAASPTTFSFSSSFPPSLLLLLLRSSSHPTTIAAMSIASFLFSIGVDAARPSLDSACAADGANAAREP